MTSQTFFALFWGWLTVIVTAMFFIRPKALHDVKRLIVENRAFGLTKGVLVIAWPEISSNTNYETRIKTTRLALVVVGALAVWMLGAVYA